MGLAEAVPGRYRALVIVAGFSGLRWAELVGLRRRHVDLAGARLHVVEQAAEVEGRIIVGPPKTEAGRRVVTCRRSRSGAGRAPGPLRPTRPRRAGVHQLGRDPR